LAIQGTLLEGVDELGVQGRGNTSAFKSAYLSSVATLASTTLVPWLPASELKATPAKVLEKSHQALGADVVAHNLMKGVADAQVAKQ
jgi:hypothetical protein